ncbi:Uncharacterised protein [Brevibacterium iodinum]|nr:Uncharacterised protein [Brevibacterium iodinum]
MGRQFGACDLGMEFHRHPICGSDGLEFDSVDAAADDAQSHTLGAGQCTNRGAEVLGTSDSAHIQQVESIAVGSSSARGIDPGRARLHRGRNEGNRPRGGQPGRTFQFRQRYSAADDLGGHPTLFQTTFETLRSDDDDRRAPLSTGEQVRQKAMFETLRQRSGKILTNSSRHQVHLRNEVRPCIPDFSDMRHPQQSRQSVAGQQKRQCRSRGDDDIGAHSSPQPVDDYRHRTCCRHRLVEQLTSHRRSAVQVRHAEDPLTVDSGVPGTAEAHVDSTAPPPDIRAEETVPVGIRVMRVRCHRDDVVSCGAQMVDEDAPPSLRCADLGIVIMTEQNDSHAVTASVRARRFNHMGRSA